MNDGPRITDDEIAAIISNIDERYFLIKRSKKYFYIGGFFALLVAMFGLNWETARKFMEAQDTKAMVNAITEDKVTADNDVQDISNALKKLPFVAIVLSKETKDTTTNGWVTNIEVPKSSIVLVNTTVDSHTPGTNASFSLGGSTCIGEPVREANHGLYHAIATCFFLFDQGGSLPLRAGPYHPETASPFDSAKSTYVIIGIDK